MSLRAYLRGIGIGMLVTALILIFSSKKDGLTDSEIRQRAKEMGMVQGNELLIGTEVSSDSASKNKSDEIVIAGEDKGKGTDGTAADKSGKAASLNKASSNKAPAKSSASSSSEKPRVTFSNDKSPAVADAAEAVNASSGSSAANQPRSTTAAADTSSDTDDAAQATANPGEDEAAVAGGSTGNSTAAQSETGEDTETEEAPAEETASSGATYTVHVSKGESSYAVAKALEEAGIVKSAVEFDKYLVSQGIDRRISAGDHTVPSSGSYEEIGKALAP